MSPPLLPRLQRFAWGLLWLLFALAMVRDWSRDPYDAALQGTRRYGHNHESALTQGLIASLLELLVAYLVVPSWTSRGPVWRAAAGLFLFGLCVPLAGVLTMHAGGIAALHLLWVLVVTVVLLVITIARVVVAVRA